MRAGAAPAEDAGAYGARPQAGVLWVRLLHQYTAAADGRLAPRLDALNASRRTRAAGS